MNTKTTIGFILSSLSIAAIPSIAYIHSQGESAAVQLQLSESIKILNVSVISLTEKTAELSSDLRSEIVKINHLKEASARFERRQDEIEKRVNEISENVARLQTKEG